MAAAATLLWLGGSEEDIAIDVLLQGLWVDGRGSTYRVSGGGGAFDVLTVRPNGARHFTQGLVRRRGATLTWGREPRQFAGSVDGPILTWRRGTGTFRWTKIQ